MHLALNKTTNDLIFSSTGLARVSKGRFVVQQVRCKLRTMLGEWLLDPSVGYIALSDLRKNYDLFDLEARIQEIVLTTQGVLSMDDLELDLQQRQLTVNFTAKTIFGVIDTRIPWDDSDLGDVTGEVLPDVGEYLTHNGIVVTFNGLPIPV